MENGGGRCLSSTGSYERMGAWEGRESVAVEEEAASFPPREKAAQPGQGASPPPGLPSVGAAGQGAGSASNKKPQVKACVVGQALR